MAQVTFHPHQNQEPKVKDLEQTENYLNWMQNTIHSTFSIQEIETRTKESFIYDMELYLSFQKSY